MTKIRGERHIQWCNQGNVHLEVIYVEWIGEVGVSVFKITIKVANITTRDAFHV